jgi:hypothetical protein
VCVHFHFLENFYYSLSPGYFLLLHIYWTFMSDNLVCLCNCIPSHLYRLSVIRFFKFSMLIILAYIGCYFLVPGRGLSTTLLWLPFLVPPYILISSLSAVPNVHSMSKSIWLDILV